MSLGFNCKITLCILSAGKALYKRAKIWELNCLEVETDVWESLQSQFSFFLSVWWRGRAGKSLKTSWAACWAKGRRDICSPGHRGNSCPWLLGVVCFSRLESELHKPWAFRTEGHSTENEEEWQNFTLKSLPGQDILALHHMCQKDTVEPHLVKQQSTILHSLYYKKEETLWCSVKVTEGRSA